MEMRTVFIPREVFIRRKDVQSRFFVQCVFAGAEDSICCDCKNEETEACSHTYFLHR